jgi:UDP-2-acetamido-3-amino-2,3-dideoxy-glucuronate N-acetyltransferase
LNSEDDHRPGAEAGPEAGADHERDSNPVGFIHPSAVVDADATIGEGTRIWHFCHVGSGAHVGARCVLGQNVYVAGSVRIGDRCRIQNNVSLYDGVSLEDDVFVGPSVVFTNVERPRAFLSRRTEFQPTRIGRGSTLGANATIVCGVRIGAYGFVAAGAVVTRDVPAHALVQGVPARQVGWVCRCGRDLIEDPTPTGGGWSCPDCREGQTPS